LGQPDLVAERIAADGPLKRDGELSKEI
jgi:hypothetical protein